MVWKKAGVVSAMHTVYHQGAGPGGKPTRSQPLAAPQLIADVPFLYTAEEQAHMGRLLYGEADSIPHEEEGGGWDMLDRGCGMQEEEGICWTGDVECGEGGGWAGM